MVDIKKIAGDVLRTKKPKKAECIAHIEMLVELINHGNVESIEPHLTSLYAFFDAARPAKKAESDLFAWVAQAVTKDQARTDLSLPYCDDQGFLVATDGRRLHWIENSGRDTDTFYNKWGRPVQVEFTYPNWRTVKPCALPYCEPMPEVVYCAKPEKSADKGTARFEVGGVAFIFNAQFLREALAGMDSPNIRFAGSLTPVHIADGTRNAVIMPLRP